MDSVEPQSAVSLIILRSVCYVGDHTVQAFKRTGKNKLRYMFLYFCKEYTFCCFPAIK